MDLATIDIYIYESIYSISVLHMNKHVSLGFQFEGLPRLHPAAESLTHVFHLDVAFQKPGKAKSSKKQRCFVYYYVYIYYRYM